MIYTLLSTKIKPFGFSFVIFKRETLFKIERSTRKKKYLEHIENYCFDNLKNLKF